MNQRLKLLAVLAHPDDESLGFGGTLAKYAAEGIETFLVTATRGERGRFGSLGKGGDPVEVGRAREAELRAAAAVLGIREVSILNYPDGAVDQVEATTAIRAVGRKSWHTYTDECRWTASRDLPATRPASVRAATTRSSPPATNRAEHDVE